MVLPADPKDPVIYTDGGNVFSKTVEDGKVDTLPDYNLWTSTAELLAYLSAARFASRGLKAQRSADENGVTLNKEWIRGPSVRQPNE